jgi:hypothetical protein
MNWLKENSSKNNTIKIIVSFLLIMGLYMFFIKPDVWLGFYYPNQNDLSKNVQSQKLSSLEECRNWVDTQIPLYNPSGTGYDYECGKECEYDESYDLYLCKKTLE